jgi:CheY-like chemotaxis protein
VTLTLLAVDDSKTMRKVVEITFAGEDCRTILADGPSDALGKLRAERPTIALVDAILGTASGYDLCQELKAESPGLGVIIFSSKQHPYDRSRGGAVGADDFIDKPFDTQALIDKVAAVSQKMTAQAAQRPARPVEQPATAGMTPARPLGAGLGTPLGRPAASAFGGGTAPHAAPGSVGQTAGGSLGLRSPGAAPSGTSNLGSSPQVARPEQPSATLGRTPFAAKPAEQHTHHPAPAPAQAPVVPAASAPAAAQTAAPVPTRAPATATVTAIATAVPASPGTTVAIDATLQSKLSGLGLTPDQMRSVLALSREVVEQVVWEVVPILAETMIREEIRRITAE